MAEQGGADATKGPLAGIRVLDLSRLLPGPYLTLILADLGADVVKVEDPAMGDYLREMPPKVADMCSRFRAVNRGKRSVALDLKSEGGAAAFRRLVATADVVVESFRPGVLGRLGLDYPALRAIKDDIILCSISGYGQTGPYRERAGHDLNYVGTAGVAAMSGEPGGRPAIPGAQIADLAGGSLWGATGILAALFGRERGQGGAHLDISMTEGALALLAAELATVPGRADRGELSRGRTELSGGLACYRHYPTRDGAWVSVAALEPKFWLAFNAAIGRQANAAEVLADAAAQERIAAEIEAILVTQTREHWAEVFAEADCCCDVVLEPWELASHPQHEARAVLSEATIAGDTFLEVRLPVGQPRRDRPSPARGEHTTEILIEAGLGADEIDALRR